MGPLLALPGGASWVASAVVAAMMAVVVANLSCWTTVSSEVGIQNRSGDDVGVVGARLRHMALLGVVDESTCMT